MPCFKLTARHLVTANGILPIHVLQITLHLPQARSSTQLCISAAFLCRPNLMALLISSLTSPLQQDCQICSSFHVQEKYLMFEMTVTSVWSIITLHLPQEALRMPINIRGGLFPLIQTTDLRNKCLLFESGSGQHSKSKFNVSGSF